MFFLCEIELGTDPIEQIQWITLNKKMNVFQYSRSVQQNMGLTFLRFVSEYNSCK